MSAARGGLKRCSACWHHKTVGEFQVQRSVKDGLQIECGACTRTRQGIAYAGKPLSVWHTKRRALRAGPGADPVRAPLTPRRKGSVNDHFREDYNAVVVMAQTLGFKSLDAMPAEQRATFYPAAMAYVRMLEKQARDALSDANCSTK